MTTQLYSHDIHLRHITPPGHPERVDRLKVVDDVLGYPEFDDLVRKQSVEIDESLLELVHPVHFLDKIRNSIPENGTVKFADDTYVSPDSWESAKYAVGASITAVDAVFEKATDNAFVAVRPPGHHAETDTAMGFCLVNNIAITARYAQHKYGVERVAIVDWDVHHGNGTQEIFYNDPNVMFASTHQMPLYPGSGAANETGVGNILNIPLRQDDDGDVLREVFITRILPQINDFSPELILISAGFDAHFRDPLGGLKFTADDFDWATGKMMEMAAKFCDNRLVSLLEGGYDLQGLAESTAAHVNRLMRG
ncbi:MAG: histone deacetylase family protein [Hyphomicrobiales bacterium]|nr:histone deacetylase family protein [Hyphomicrobiales bacterium]